MDDKYDGEGLFSFLSLMLHLRVNFLNINKFTERSGKNDSKLSKLNHLILSSAIMEGGGVLGRTVQSSVSYNVYIVGNKVEYTARSMRLARV